MPPIPGLKTAPAAGGSLRAPEFAPGVLRPSLGLYWRTIRHLRASQLGPLLRRRLLGRRRPARPRSGQARLRMAPRPPRFAEWKPGWSRQTLETQGWEFMNVPQVTASPTPWSGQDLPRLWYYHLNYCDFLNVDLTDPDDEPLLRSALRLALDWIDRNPKGRETGWEPYPLSLRIVNWLKFLIRNAARLRELGENAAIDRILNSLRAQALTLERRLEIDLGANHLLKNTKALIFAGALVEAPESSRWLESGRTLLRLELDEQILADGGHFERSPMYHAEILEDLLDLKALTSACAETVGYAPMLLPRIARMSTFLEALLHPDGEIPLLNDSALGRARPSQELLELAGSSAAPGRVPEVTALGATGYAVIRDLDSESCLIFDGGPLGPDYQLGHAHCDVLSYELSLHARRVVVDTGVSTYEAGAERSYERSTAAHNTLRVDGEEQAETWASFRVGRRPRVGQVEGAEIEGLRVVRGKHFGYQHLGVTHSRAVIHAPGNVWLVWDSLRGSGRHRAESFIHFHPAVELVSCAKNRETPAPGFDGALRPTAGLGPMRPHWILRFGEYRYFFMTSGGGRLTQAESWYAPEFGLRQSSAVILWTWAADLPTAMLYSFVPVDDTPPVVRLVDADQIEVAGVAVRLD
jgi:uncharacterized heparinase superfamily protein